MDLLSIDAFQRHHEQQLQAAEALAVEAKAEASRESHTLATLRGQLVRLADEALSV